MVHAKPATGRHFGMEVSDEYILEKWNTCKLYTKH
jgi:3-dehydroquinate synthase II